MSNHRTTSTITACRSLRIEILRETKNVYVALSRSSGRDTIRLLRPFDREVFEQRHELELLEEDDRLEQLDAATTNDWAKIVSGELNDFPHSV